MGLAAGVLDREVRRANSSPGRSRPGQRPGVWQLARAAWPYLVPALVLSVVYGFTVQRSTGNAFSLDTTKFEVVGKVLGTPHPPGYPLYTMLNAAFVRLLPLGEVAFRANLLSAVFAVSACVIVVRILSDLGVSRPLQAGGATALGLLPALWQNAIVAEVYSFTALFMVAVLACVTRWERTGRRAWLRVGVLVFALSFAHATSNVLLIPGLVLYLLLRHPLWLLRPRELVTLLPAGAGLALLPYAYLPWRTAHAGNSWVETQVYDRHSLSAALTGAQFGDRMWAVEPEVAKAVRLPVLADAAVDQLGALLVLAALGFLVLVYRRFWLAALTGTWAAVTAWFVLRYLVDDWLTLLLPVWLLAGLWALVGVHWCLSHVPRRRSQLATAAVALALPLVAMFHGHPDLQRRDPAAQHRVDAAVAAVPDHSLIFAATLEERQQFVYRLLPDDLGLRRQVWAAEGPNHSQHPDQAVFFLHEYCAPQPGPWPWPWHEQLASPSVPRGLQMFIYGDAYAAEVQRYGFRVRPFQGQLSTVTCLDDADAGRQPVGRR